MQKKTQDDISGEVHEDDDELHAWCLLEEGDNEQWQEVTSKKSKLKKKKKLDHESLLSVKNISGVPPRKVIEVKNNWVNIRAHNGHRSCRARHASRDVPESQTGSYEHNKEVVAANGEKNPKTWVTRPYHSSPWKECTGALNSGALTL